MLVLELLKGLKQIQQNQRMARIAFNHESSPDYGSILIQLCCCTPWT
uniref:Uncharacterized protein n=1 Tax=Rhizophora mucronata TaxID=61149 RepID=A0A2P2QSS6_RHIMU